MVVATVWGEREMVTCCLMDTVLFWENEKVLKVDSGDCHLTMWMYLMILNPTFQNGENGKFYVSIFNDKESFLNRTNLCAISKKKKPTKKQQNSLQI